MKTISKLLLVMVTAVTVPACHDGGGGDEPPPSHYGSVGQGWIRIASPDYEPVYAVATSTLSLEGEVFVSPGWWHCCPFDAAVDVTWTNVDTKATGACATWVTGSYFVTNHWSISLALQPGVNHFEIWARDPGNNAGAVSVTVTYTP